MCVLETLCPSIKNVSMSQHKATDIHFLYIEAIDTQHFLMSKTADI